MGLEVEVEGREEWTDRRRIDYKKMRRLEVGHRVRKRRKRGKRSEDFFCLGEVLDVKNLCSRLRRLHLSALAKILTACDILEFGWK